MRTRGQRGRSARTTLIVETSKEILAEMSPMTVRGVCYQLFNRKVIPSMSRIETQRVSRILTGARERGEIDWDLIVDRGRPIMTYRVYDNPESLVASAIRSYRKDFWGWQPYYVIVVSEKATLEGVLSPVRAEWGVDWLAVGGFNSATRMHDLAESIRTETRETIILYVGDWDPSGMYMSEQDFPDRLREYGAPEWNYQIYRVALTEDDVAVGNLPSFDAEEKTTDARYKWFVQRFGDTCIEVDALNPNRLRERVGLAIQHYVDMDAWQRNQLAEQAERQSIMDVFSKMREGA